MADFIFNSPFAAPLNFLADFDPVTTNPNFIELSTTDAASVRNNALLSVFFHQNDIRSLLNQTDGVGIRLYPILDSNNKHSLLATGIHISGSDLIKSFLPNKTTEDLCLVSEGTSSPASNTPVPVAAQMIQDLEANVKNTTGDKEAVTPMANTATALNSAIAKAAFTSGAINNLLAGNPVGLRFYTVKIRFANVLSQEVKTLAVEAEGGGSNMVISALPCPPNCGGGGYTNDLQAV